VIDTYEGEDGHEQEYCGIIQNVIKLDYQRFDMFVFDVRWFKDILDKEWWYVIPMEPRTKPLFHSLLPESGQPAMDTDTTSDQRDNNKTHPCREEVDGSWVAAQLLHVQILGVYLCKHSRAEADRKNKAEIEAQRDKERNGEMGKEGYSLSGVLRTFFIQVLKED
jgi:hypothetical protein